MATPSPIAPAALIGLVGEEIGVSDWTEITQARIDAFAEVSEDWQFIHVDPARAAAEAPFGGTIAHGFLTVSLLSRMGQQALPKLDGGWMGVNYGFDRLRFLAPVPVGARVRGRFTLAAAEERNPGELTLKYAVTVEVKDSDKPALAAEWLTRQYFREEGAATGV
ncbi:MAG: MaoC family dehydratase [Rhodobacteraceae bacterium]|nr:MaoC family dehydratase [Paracoccaceae bacterium]